MIMPTIASGPNAGDLKTPSCSAPNNGQITECAGCGTVIHDRYYLLAVDRQWHEDCLRCSQCKAPFNTELKCFLRDGQIYCKEDYYRIFAPMKRCTRCGQGIGPTELVMRVRDNIYHIQCFTCAWCNSPLSQGDYFGLRERLVYCRVHFELLTSGIGNFQLNSENAIHPLSSTDHHRPGDAVIPAYGSIYSPNTVQPQGPACGLGSNGNVTITGGVRKGRPRKRKGNGGITEGNSPGGSIVSRRVQSPSLGNINDGAVSLSTSSSLESGCLSDGQSSLSGSLGLPTGHPSGQRTKRMRTSFKHHQLRTMKSYFSINQNPDAKDLKQLAQKTGLSKRVLQVWFQNARAKWRRNSFKLGSDSTDPNASGDLTSNGQTSLLAHPSTPSTGIGSPTGSSRPFSSPSPSPLSVPPHDQHQASIEYNHSHNHNHSHTSDSIIPLSTFQELY